MTCSCGNAARYISESGSLTCGICPIKRGEDSIRIADVPRLLAWARKYIAINEPEDCPHCWMGKTDELRAILGRDITGG